MKVQSQKDFCAGLMFMAAGTAFAVGAVDYSLGSSARPGPGYFPLGLGILLALLGLVVFAKALRTPTADGEPIGPIAWKPLTIVVASIVVFGAALPRLGMALALPLLIVMISMAGDEFRWRDVLLTCAVLTVGSWAVFIKGLGLVLPVWPPFITG